MKIQLQIIAAITMALSLGLAILVLSQLMEFLSLWWGSNSVVLDSPFLKKYDEYFSLLNVSPMQTLLTSAIMVAISYGLFKLKWWAGCAFFLLSLYDLFWSISEILAGRSNNLLYGGVVFTVYILIILMGNKEHFRVPIPRPSSKS